MFRLGQPFRNILNYAERSSVVDKLPFIHSINAQHTLSRLCWSKNPTRRMHGDLNFTLQSLYPLPHLILDETSTHLQKIMLHDEPTFFNTVQWRLNKRYRRGICILALLSLKFLTLSLKLNYLLEGGRETIFCFCAYMYFWLLWCFSLLSLFLLASLSSHVRGTEFIWSTEAANKPR